MDSSELDFKPLLSVRSTSDVSVSSQSIGPAYPSIQTHVIAIASPCQDLSVAGKRAGLSGSQSSLLLTILGLLPRMSSIRGADGCPNCGAACGPSGMPLCQFNCRPQMLAGDTCVDESLLLPTPTASAYGSCRGGAAGRVGKWRMSLHSRGILHPENWERMMGFPIGHTDVSNLETQSSLTAPSSSLEPSEAV